MTSLMFSMYHGSIKLYFSPLIYFNYFNLLLYIDFMANFSITTIIMKKRQHITNNIAIIYQIDKLFGIHWYANDNITEIIADNTIIQGPTWLAVI